MGGDGGRVYAEKFIKGIKKCLQADREFVIIEQEVVRGYRLKEEVVGCMNKTSLNDLVYGFEPLKVVSPDPDYKVDEIELQKSIDKSRKMMEVIRKYKDERVKSEI